jgi:hypothetical protein
MQQVMEEQCRWQTDLTAVSKRLEAIDPASIASLQAQFNTLSAVVSSQVRPAPRRAPCP